MDLQFLKNKRQIWSYQTIATTEKNPILCCQLDFL